MLRTRSRSKRPFNNKIDVHTYLDQLIYDLCPHKTCGDTRGSQQCSMLHDSFDLQLSVLFEESALPVEQEQSIILLSGDTTDMPCKR